MSLCKQHRIGLPAETRQRELHFVTFFFSPGLAMSLRMENNPPSPSTLIPHSLENNSSAFFLAQRVRNENSNFWVHKHPAATRQTGRAGGQEDVEGNFSDTGVGVCYQKTV